MDGDIRIEPSQTSYEPGATLTAALHWNLDSAPHAISVSILWYTEGKGDEDSAVVKREVFTDPGQTGTQTVRLELPRFPYSFSGKLIQLIWAIEAVVDDKHPVARTPIIIAPHAREISL